MLEQADEETQEFMASVRQGLRDCHLGYIFSHKLVFGALEGTGGRFYSRWYYRSIINLKKSWWRLKTPWQRFVSHRNCPYCIKFGTNPQPWL